MKKIFLFFVLLMASQFAFAEIISITQDNFNAFQHHPRIWKLKDVDYPIGMHIQNNSGKLIFIDMFVDYGAGSVALWCNDFFISAVKENSHGGCLLKNGKTAFWQLTSGENGPIKNSFGTFTVYKGE